MFVSVFQVVEKLVFGEDESTSDLPSFKCHSNGIQELVLNQEASWVTYGGSLVRTFTELRLINAFIALKAIVLLYRIKIKQDVF